MAQDDLRRPVLSGLYAICEVLIGKAGIAEIYNFEEYFIIEIYFDIFPFQLKWVPLLLWILSLSLSANMISNSVDRLE